MSSQKILILVSLIGISITGIFFWQIHRRSWEDIRKHFENDSMARFNLLEKAFQNHWRDIQSIVLFYECSENVERDEFRKFVKPLIAHRGGIDAFYWAPLVRFAERVHFEEKARQDISQFRISENQGHRLVSAGDREKYCPVYYAEPENQAIYGFDFGSDPELSEAMGNAAKNDLPWGIPARPQEVFPRQESFFLFAPVYRNYMPVEQRKESLEGFVATLVNPSEMFSLCLRPTPRRGLETRLLDVTAPSGPKVVVHWETRLKGREGSLGYKIFPPLKKQFSLPFPGRQWQIEISATEAYWENNFSALYCIIPGVGLFITLLLVLYLRSLFLNQKKIEKMIVERTHALEESKKKYSHLFENMGDAAFLADAETGEIIETNRQAEEMLSRTRDEIVGMHHSKLHPAQGYETYLQIFAKHVKDGHASDVECEVVRKDGSIVPATITSSIMVLSGRRLNLGLFRDITERKKAEEELRSKKEELDRFFFLALDFLCIADMNGRFRKLNREWERTLGYPLEEMEGRSFMDFIHPKDRLETRAAIQDMENGKSILNFVNRYRCKNGSYRWLEWRSVPVGGLIYAAARDITDRKRSEDLFHRGFSENPSPMAISDIETGRYVEVNEAFLRVLEFECKEDVLGKTSVELGIFQESSQRENVIQGKKEGLSFQNVELKVRSRLGNLKDGLFAGDIVDIAGERYLLTIMLDITERKQAEEALQRKEAKLRSIFLAAPVGIGVAVNRVIVEVNRFMCEMTGYTHEELVGMAARQLYPTEQEFEFVGNEKYRQIEEKGSGTVETRWRRKSGEIIDVLLSSTPIAKRELSLGVTFTALDISESKKAKKTTILNERRLEAMLKMYGMGNQSVLDITHFALESAVEVTQSDLGYLAFVNEDETVLNMYAWSRKAMSQCEIQDRTISYLVQETGLWGEAVRQRKPIVTNDYEAPNLCKKGYPKGHVKVIRHMNIPVFEGERIVIVAGVGNKTAPYDEEDVHQLSLLMRGMWDMVCRKKAEESLRKSEERLRMVVTNTPVVFFALDLQGNFILSEGKGLEKLKFRPGEVVGRSVFEVYEKYPDLLDGVRRALNGENFSSLVNLGPLVYEVWYSPARNDRGKLEGTIGLAMDITERKRSVMERELLLKEVERKNKELESIIYVASHDLRSPLVNIQGFSQRLGNYFNDLKERLEILAMKGALEIPEGLFQEQVPKALHYILSSGQKMDILIKGLLRLSRTGRAELHPTRLDMNRMIENILSTMAFQIQKAAAVVEVGTLPDCWGDMNQVNQLFSNLLDNAIKYSHPSRALRIEVTGSMRDGRTIYVVSDTGIGIAKEHQSKIWELFYRLDPQGIVGGEGLGLTLVRRIVERHNGKTWIESEPNVGSRFYVELPTQS